MSDIKMSLILLREVCQRKWFVSTPSRVIWRMHDLLLPLSRRLTGLIKPVFKTIYADDLQKSGVSSVDVVDIVQIDRAPDKSYQPGHPKADKDGYIYTAAVDTEEEMVEMLEASRQYENNVEVISTLRGLMMRTINMGKKIGSHHDYNRSKQRPSRSF